MGRKSANARGLLCQNTWEASPFRPGTWSSGKQGLPAVTRTLVSVSEAILDRTEVS